MNSSVPHKEQHTSDIERRVQLSLTLVRFVIFVSGIWTLILFLLGEQETTMAAALVVSCSPSKNKMSVQIPETKITNRTSVNES